jgi:hypothetical protein
MAYFLPTGRVRLQLTLMSDGTLTITTSVMYIPDLQQACFFRYQQSYFSDDTIKVTLTDNGLLSSVTSTTIDATPQIVQGLAEVAVNTAKLLASAAGGGESPKPQLTIDEVINPLNREDIDRLNNKDLKRLGVSLTVTPDFDTRSSLAGFPKVKSESEGILYRPALPYRLTFECNPSSAGTVNGAGPLPNLQPGIISATVELPNEAPTLAVEVSRAAFVTNSAEITFTNGMLQAISYKKPSQAVGLVQIPVDLSKQLLSVPNDLLTIRYANVAAKAKQQTDQLTNQTAIINDQAAQLKAQTDLIAAQKALAEAQEQKRKDAASKPDSTGNKSPAGP